MKRFHVSTRLALVVALGSALFSGCESSSTKKPSPTTSRIGTGTTQYLGIDTPKPSSSYGSTGRKSYPGEIRSPSGTVLYAGDRPQSAAQKAAAKAATDDYYKSLADQIAALDDGTSSADVVARSAIAILMPKLRRKVELQTAHLTETPFEKQQMQQLLAALPSATDVSHATALVLKFRSNKTLLR